METIFYIFCTTLPSHILAFALFWDFQWRSKKVALLLATINVFLKMSTISYCIYHQINCRSVEFFYSAIGFLIYCIFIRVNFFKLLFTFIIIVDYLVIIRGFASFFASAIFHFAAQSWLSSIFCIILYSFTLPLLIHFFQKIARQVYTSNSTMLWHTIWLPPCMLSIITLIFTNTYLQNNTDNWQFLLSRICLLICIIVTYYMLLHSIDSIQKQIALEEQSKQAEILLRIERQQYKQLQEYIQEFRHARHDLRQHLHIIQVFLNTHNEDALRDYIKKYGDSLPKDTLHLYCNNLAINSLLNYYTENFSKKKFHFQVNADFPEKLPIPEPDLCVILGNLLENAQNACSSQEAPFIHISLKYSAPSAITILVDNTAPAPPVKCKNGSLLSSKVNGGVGTQSILYLAKQYNGTTDFQWKDGVFYASVFLNPKT